MSLLKCYYASADGHPVDAYTGVAWEKQLAISHIVCVATAALVVTFHDGTGPSDPKVGGFQSSGAATGHALQATNSWLPIHSKLWIEFVSGTGTVYIYSK